MELQPLSPEDTSRDLPVEEPPAQRPGGEPEKRGRRRLWLLVPAALLACAMLAAACSWTAIRVFVSPLGALRAGAEKVAPLPQPLSLGFLGQLTLGDREMNCSGVLDLQAGDDGLALFLRDCTLGGEAGSAAFSAFVGPDDAAVSFPQLTGGDEGWYGVSLDVPLRDQAQGTLVEWYYNAAGLDALQSAADTVHSALGEVHALGPGKEGSKALRTLLEKARREPARTEGGYVLLFAASEEDVSQLRGDLGLPSGLLDGPVTLEFSLNEKGTLRGVSAAGGKGRFTLDLGEDPESEPNLFLEADWTGENGKTQSAALAFTLSQAGAVEVPEYQNAFRLLPRG